MQVVETLVLDPARRLVLVRIDDEERLLLLGEGRELIEPRGVGNSRVKLVTAIFVVPTRDELQGRPCCR